MIVLLIMLASCLRSKSTINNNDYCQLYTPLTDEMSKSVIDYVKKTSDSIKDKNWTSKSLTPEEEFVEIMINHASMHDKKYYLKNCDEE